MGVLEAQGDVRWCQSHKEAQICYVAAYDLMERVTNYDQRVDIWWDLMDYDQRAHVWWKEAQPHTDCQHGNPWAHLLLSYI